jgi:GUN4-like/TIR domain
VTEEAISVFLSYSRKDKDLLDSFAVHLAGLVNTGQITTWHDRDIEAGSEWEPAIQHQLNTAKIIILLISANFIASEYCYGNELKRAIERHDGGEAHVIPVILKPCLWNLPKILFSKLNVLPNDALPVTQWNDADAAFTLVVEHIARVVDRLGKDRQQQQELEKKRILREQAAERQRQLNLEQQQQDAERQHLVPEHELASEKEIDYRNLRDLLKAGKWLEADKETLKVMLKAANRKSQGWLNFDSLEKFPCQDLKTINQLWVTASNGHFGFTIQKKIWEKCGSPMSYNDDWKKFGDAVGWFVQEKWVSYSDLKFDPVPGSFSLREGELPRGWTRRWDGGGMAAAVGLWCCSLLSRKDL